MGVLADEGERADVAVFALRTFGYHRLRGHALLVQFQLAVDGEQLYEGLLRALHARALR